MNHAKEPTHVECELPAAVQSTPSEGALIETITATLSKAGVPGAQGVAVEIFETIREHDARVVHPTQDPKYSIRGNRLINAERLEDIPEDEPVFMLRARDALAISALAKYRDVCITHDRPQSHLVAVEGRMTDFYTFAKRFPYRIKYPTTGGTEQEEMASRARVVPPVAPAGEPNPKVPEAGLRGHPCPGEGCAVCDAAEAGVARQGSVIFRNTK